MSGLGWAASGRICEFELDAHPPFCPSAVPNSPRLPCGWPEIRPSYTLPPEGTGR